MKFCDSFSEDNYAFHQVCALRHLTSCHEDAEKAQNAVRVHSGLPVLVKLLYPPTRWPLIKAVIGLMKNLALCPLNHTPIRKHRGMAQLVQLMMHAHQDMQTRPGQIDVIDSVRMEDIVGGCVGALHILAREPTNRAVLRSLDCIRLFVQVQFCALKELLVNSLNIDNEGGIADHYNDEHYNAFPKMFLDSYSSFRCHKKEMINSLTNDIKQFDLNM